MKRLFLLFLGTLLFAACQNKETVTTEVKADGTPYPYTIKEAEKWEMNSDSKNMQVAMSALKAFENRDTAALKAFIGDSINLVVDGYEFNGLKADFIKNTQEELTKFKSILIKMEDAESVVNADKSKQWVSLWYKQYWEDKDGKKDSANYFNDIKIKDGKIVIWSEYIQHAMKK